jgi:hypothetical protein
MFIVVGNLNCESCESCSACCTIHLSFLKTRITLQLLFFACNYLSSPSSCLSWRTTLNLNAEIVLASASGSTIRNRDEAVQCASASGWVATSMLVPNYEDDYFLQVAGAMTRKKGLFSSHRPSLQASSCAGLRQQFKFNLNLKLVSTTSSTSSSRTFLTFLNFLTFLMFLKRQCS